MRMINRIKHYSLPCVVYILSILGETIGLGDVLHAVNCGGGSHTDILGINYQEDDDPSREGTTSDYGKSLVIQRSPTPDMILYQTERYHHSDFSYEFPAPKDGDYVLVLKFCEVWFTANNQKVFDVQLNEQNIIKNLDIYSKVGRGVAHDEYIPFKIKNNKITISGKSSPIKAGSIPIHLIKGAQDNPKLNAFYVMKGSIADVPKLPEIAQEKETQEEEEEDEEDQPTKPKEKPRTVKTSGPKAADPYAADDTSSMLLPVIAAVGAFIPLLFCLCKL
ncbi:unnamed protein product [Owenia fusiformis]|uniref:Uncharacterized protein n=1 Tax=Owenia fusiformis TaxID=6347 RepID=A0A8J1TK30_OWEFU|nr:unnamed protein product [Owenia fusiformis]